MWIEVLVALALAGGLVAAMRRIGGLEAELQRLRGQNYERHYTLLDTVEKLQDEVKSLKRQVRRASGEAVRFTPDMTFAEAFELHPEAQTVLAGYHIGGCSSCAVDADDTLAAGATQARVPVGELLDALNGLLEGRPAPVAAGRRALLQIDLDYKP
jgi:hypothetical protein